MKQYFIDKFAMIREWLKKEKWFLILLSVMTISLFVSMFTEYALIACLLATIVSGIFFNWEKNLSVFLFCYSFESILIVISGNEKNNLFTSMYAFLVAICFLKYLIKVFKKEKKINLNYIIPLLAFLIYIVLTAKKFDVVRLLRYCVVLCFIYLVLECKDEVKFDNIIIYACLGIILSMIFVLFVGYSKRIINIRVDYYNYGIKKIQGLFVNPNHFAIYVVLIITLILYKFIFEDSLWGIPFFIIFPYSYANLSRNYILCFILTIVMVSIFVCVKRKKTDFIKYLSSLLLIFIVLISQFNVTKVYINRLGTIYKEACQLVGVKTEKKIPSLNFGLEKDENNSNNNDNSIENTQPSEKKEDVWIDGTPLDPGRAGLWKRYIKDYLSSPNIILFGRGILAEELGMGTHNSFIEIVWRFGIIGTLLLSVIFFLIARKLFREKSYLILMVLGVIFIINLFESCIFNSIAIMMILILMCSIKKKETNYEKNISNNTGV